MAINLLPMFVSLVFVTLLCQAECQYFTRDPQSVTVDEGSNVTLTCDSDYATECAKTYYFQWYRDPDEYVAECNSVQEDLQGRMSVLLDTNSRQYHLTIRNVQLEDSGQYWCRFIWTTYNIDEVSNRATLTVNQVLPRDKPSCELDPPQPRVNTTVQLKCTLSPNDPPNVMTWFESPLIERNQLELGRKIQPGEVYSVERVLTETDNMKEFTCVAGPNIGGPSCSIMPLQIPTTVSILPSSIALQEHQSALFTCDLEATPSQIADEYRWRVIKDVRINQDTLDDLSVQYKLGPKGKTLEILGVSLGEFNNSKITCFAYLDGSRYQSVNDSLITVTTAAQDQPSTTIRVSVATDISNTTCENTYQVSRTAVIVGGAVEVIVFVVTAVLIICYIVKNKRQNKRPNNRPCQTVERRVENPSSEHEMYAVAMTVQPINHTYADDVSEDNGGYLVPNQQGNYSTIK